MAGLLGMILTGFFHEDHGLFFSGEISLFLVQCFAAIIIVLWATVISLVMFTVLHLFHVLRVSPTIEMLGTDVVKFGWKGYELCTDTIAKEFIE
jgi:Amt family ammonium transporter